MRERQLRRRMPAERKEYTLDLKRLETQPGFPSSAINALLRHQEMVAQDNCSLAWATVCRYSEEIFTRVVDGRLPRGWRDEAAINAVRVEIIAMAGNAPPSAASAPVSAPADHRDPQWCTKVARGEAHGSTKAGTCLRLLCQRAQDSGGPLRSCLLLEKVRTKGPPPRSKRRIF